MLNIFTLIFIEKDAQMSLFIFRYFYLSCVCVKYVKLFEVKGKIKYIEFYTIKNFNECIIIVPSQTSYYTYFPS